MAAARSTARANACSGVGAYNGLQETIVSISRRWLRSGAAKACVIALLAILIVPMAQACPLGAMNVSMTFAPNAMPVACADMPAQACLAAHVQSDQAWGSDAPAIAAHAPAVLRIASCDADEPIFLAGRTSEWKHRSGAPPPRIRFCRRLE
jgi:hypothetical protein